MRFFVCLLALVAAASAAVIPGTFQQIDCDGGGWFEQIIAHASGRIYGRTDVGGVYRSDDHGGTWQFLSGDLPSEACYFVQGLAVAAGNPDVVYQAVGTSYAAGDAGRGVWKSTDGGRSWKQVLRNVNFSGNDDQRWGGECMVIQPGNDRELWAGSRGEGLYHSTDAGATWSEVAPKTFHEGKKGGSGSPKFCGILICPAAKNRPEHLWAYGDGGAWLSIDHGNTWTRRLEAKRVYRMAQKADGTAFAAGLGGSHQGLWRITAGDFQVTDISRHYLSALPYAPSKESHLATVQVLANGDIIAADLFENTCRSTDNGDTFARMPMTLTGPLTGWSVAGSKEMDGGRNSLVQDPVSGSRLYLGGGYAPYRSDDGGATWRFIHRGIGETVAWRVTFHPADPNRVWLPLADLGCATVRDGGASGCSAGYIAPHFPSPGDTVMFSHRLLISEGRVIAPGGEQNRNTARIYATRDEGATWVKLAAAGLPTGGHHQIVDAVASADRADDFLVFAGGKTGHNEGGVYRTVNGGATFTQAAGIPNGFHGGDEFEWNVSFDRDPKDANVRYLMLRERGFFKSSDRGATWGMTAAQPRDSDAAIHVDPVTGRIWAGMEAEAGKAAGIDFSDDGGATWKPLRGVESVKEFDAHHGRLAIIGRLPGEKTNHIHYSADRGATWNEITRPGARFANARAVAIDPWRDGTVWISTNGRAVARFTPK